MELKRPFYAVSELHVDLLIVPYGIETPAAQGGVEASDLLIVPYGIETRKCLEYRYSHFGPFNRTLWN